MKTSSLNKTITLIPALAVLLLFASARCTAFAEETAAQAEPAESADTNPPPAASIAQKKPMVEWQISELNKTDKTPREKAEELFAMFPKLDRQGQRKVA